MKLYELHKPLAEDLEDTKRKVVKQVAKAEDEKALNQVHSYIHRHNLNDAISALIGERGLPVSLVKMIVPTVIDSDGTPDEKFDFIKGLTTTGIIDINALLTPRKLQSLDDIVIPKYQHIYDSIKMDLVNLAGKIPGIGAQIGKGEILLNLLSPKISQSSVGDLKIGSQEVEVKASRGRLNAPKGFGSTVSVWPEVAKMMGEIAGVDPKTISSKPYNFRKKNMEFSTFLQQYATYDQAKAFIANMMKKLYPAMDDSDIAPMTKLIQQDGSFDTAQFIQAWTYSLFDYYKKVKKWDGLLWINDKNLDLYYAESSKDAMAADGALYIDSLLNWNSSQNNAPQLYLK